MDIYSDQGNTVVNGVTFLDSDPNFSLTGANNPFNNDSGGPAAAGSGLAKLQDDFLYGGTPGVLTLTGLTPGQQYKLRLYVFSFGGNLQNFSFDDTGAPTTYANIPRNAGNDTVPGSIDYTYTLGAAASHLTVTVTPQSGDTFHFYAFSNEVVPEPTSAALLVMSGLGLVARRRRA